MADYVINMPGWHNAAKYTGVSRAEREVPGQGRPPGGRANGAILCAGPDSGGRAPAAGKTDGESLRTALAQTDLPTTVIGAVKFNADGTGVVKTLLPQWQNGKSELIWPKEQASAPSRYPAPPFSQR